MCRRQKDTQGYGVRETHIIGQNGDLHWRTDFGRNRIVQNHGTYRRHGERVGNSANCHGGTRRRGGRGGTDLPDRHSLAITDRAVGDAA